MFKHILKMVWNRKKLNALIILEIFISFLVLFGVSAVYVHFVRLYSHPLGFDYADTWELRIDRGGRWKPEHFPLTENLRDVLLAQEPVLAVEVLNATPFRGSTWSSSVSYGDKKLSSLFNYASDGAMDMLGLELIEGRWFSPEDDGVEWTAVVINRTLRTALFGDESPLGKDIADLDPGETGGRRVVGVIEEFRQHGEFFPLRNYAFSRHPMASDTETSIQGLQLKLKPGTTAAYEEELFRVAASVAPEWRFVVTDWAELRETMSKEFLIPMGVLAVVSIFLLLMVALGLLGVLWQNVARRTQEIGLRRAMGAAARRIHLQITGELLMITTFGVICGMFVALQLPILGTFAALTWSTSLYSLVSAVVMIYVISFVCALYPSWFATRIEPAEALHYE
jgi:putative ABC transport system permease protein